MLYQKSTKSLCYIVETTTTTTMKPSAVLLLVVVVMSAVTTNAQFFYQQPYYGGYYGGYPGYYGGPGFFGGDQGRLFGLLGSAALIGTVAPAYGYGGPWGRPWGRPWGAGRGLQFLGAAALLRSGNPFGRAIGAVGLGGLLFG
ncbi:hypothetical protein ACF0H5_008775 [Mactra antiquata]